MDNSNSFGKKENLTLDSDVTNTDMVGYEEGSDTSTEAIRDESREMQGLVAYIQKEYNRSKDRRRSDEERWLDCYENYRGIYSSDVQFTDTEKSQIFMKITKTKVLAAYAQITEILFSSSRFPLGVEQTAVPEGILDAVHWDPKEPKDPEAKEDEGEIFQTSTVARKDILDSVGPLKKSLSRIKDKLKEGVGLTPTASTWEPAKEAAKKLDKQILDQLEEASASKSIRSTIFEMCLFGSGVYKGPFALKKEYPKWNEDGKYDPVQKTIPDCSYVSVWDIYPDADARTIDEAEMMVQRYRMNRSQLRALKKRPMFRKETIEQVITEGPSYSPLYWEDQLRDDSTGSNTTNRWEVLEFWGVVDKDIAEEAGLEIPKDLEDNEQIQINAWIAGDYILRIVLNPFTPHRIPYHIVPYEINPYSIFGVGIAENMLDTQLLMNGFMRMAVDNAVLSSNVMFEVNETNLVPGQDMKVYPGKIFRTQGQLGQSIHTLKVENVSQECLLMFDKARQLADEATGMPSYSHGVSGIMSTGRTASGMSMLMGAAKENIKSVVRNIDDFLLMPLGKGLFAFNMQFNFDKDFIGDLDIVPKATESLMRNEVQAQKLLQFYQLTQNPQDAPWVKRDYILRELAKAMELDSDKVVNDAREAAIQADIMKSINDKMGVDPAKAQAQSQGGNPSAAPSPQDPTGNGGGNIAPGMAPGPGAQGSTASGGGANGGSPQAQQQVPQ